MAFFGKLKDRLFKSSSKLDEGLSAIVDGAAQAPAAPEEAPKPGLLGRVLGRGGAEPRRVLDDAMLESLEELLIASDMGVETALAVTANIAEGRMGRRARRRPSASWRHSSAPQASGGSSPRATRSAPRRWNSCRSGASAPACR